MRFRPSPVLTVALFALVLVFARLGYWQSQRKAEKEELFEQFENAPAMSIEQAVDAGHRFALVEGFGRYDPERHVLVDNRIYQGRAGVHVLTPFHVEGGPTVLVNRGWLPLPPDRSKLPDVPTDDRMQTISGRLNLLDTVGPRLGEADRLETGEWPQLVTYLDRGPLSEALGMELPPWTVQLDDGLGSGFEGRQWQAAVMPPATHGAYAVQWFALSAAALVIWISLGFRNAGNREKE